MINGESNLFGTRIPPPDIMFRTIGNSGWGDNVSLSGINTYLINSGLNEIYFLFDTVIIVGVWILIINITDQEIVRSLTILILNNSTSTDNVSKNNFTSFIYMVTFIV